MVPRLFCSGCTVALVFQGCAPLPQPNMGRIVCTLPQACNRATGVLRIHSKNMPPDSWLLLKVFENESLL